MPSQKGAAATAVFSAANVANPTNLAPTIPAHVGGDLLLCFTCCRSATPTVATPSGWTSLLNITGTNGRLALFGRVATASGTATPTITWSGLTTGSSGTPCGAQCAVFTDMLGTTTGIIDVTGTVENGAASTSLAAGGASITTLTANALVLSLCTRLDDAGSWAASSDPNPLFTMIGAVGSTSGADFSMAWSYHLKTTAGAVTAGDYQLSGASSFASSGVQVALKPYVPVSFPVTASDTIVVSDSVGGVVIAPTEYDVIVDADNPVSHWKMGGSTQAIDRKGVLDLPASNGPIAVTDGLVNSNDSDPASSLDRSTNQAFFTAPETDLGAPYNTPTYSWEVWFRLDALPSANAFVIMRSAGGGFNFQLRVSATGTLHARHATSTGGTGVESADIGPVVIGTTYHVVGAFNGTSFRVWVNTVQKVNSSQTLIASTPNNPPTIGRNQETANSTFPGVIDEVAWYSTPLTLTNVQAHYNAGTSSGGPTAYPRTATDTVAISDAVIRSGGSQIRTANDNFSVSDSAVGIVAASYPRAASDAIAISDVATRTAASRTRNATDTMSTSDSVTRAASTRVRPSTDSFAISDIASGVAIRGYLGAANDSWVISDVATRSTATRTRTTTDSIVTSDLASAVKTGGVLRAATDSITVSDVAIRAATARVRTANDAVNFSDSVVRTTIRPRATTDSINVSDIVIAQKVTLRTVSDSVAIADNATRATNARIRNAIDAIALSDSALRAGATRQRTATDSISISDTVTGLRVIIRVSSDVIITSDIAGRAIATRTRTASDAITINSTATRTLQRAGIASDAVLLSDTATLGSMIRARTAIDSIVFSDIAGATIAEPTRRRCLAMML